MSFLKYSVVAVGCFNLAFPNIYDLSGKHLREVTGKQQLMFYGTWSIANENAVVSG